MVPDQASAEADRFKGDGVVRDGSSDVCLFLNLAPGSREYDSSLQILSALPSQHDIYMNCVHCGYGSCAGINSMRHCQAKCTIPLSS